MFKREGSFDILIQGLSVHQSHVLGFFNERFGLVEIDHDGWISGLAVLQDPPGSGKVVGRMSQQQHVTSEILELPSGMRQLVPMWQIQTQFSAIEIHQHLRMIIGDWMGASALNRLDEPVAIGWMNRLDGCVAIGTP